MPINRTVLSGNIVDEPVYNTTHSGTSVANFVMAVDNRHRTASGELINDTLFVRVSTYGGSADSIEGYLHRGDKVVASGQLRPNHYHDEQGVRRDSIQLVAEQIEFWNYEDALSVAYV